MPTVTIAAGDIAAHNMSVTSTVTIVNVRSDRTSRVDIITDGGAKLWYTTDGTTPAIAGSKCYLMPAVAGVDTRFLPGPAALRLISEGTAVVSVQAAD